MSSCHTHYSYTPLKCQSFHLRPYAPVVFSCCSHSLHQIKILWTSHLLSRKPSSSLLSTGKSIVCETQPINTSQNCRVLPQYPFNQACQPHIVITSFLPNVFKPICHLLPSTTTKYFGHILVQFPLNQTLQPLCCHHPHPLFSVYHHQSLSPASTYHHAQLPPLHTNAGNPRISTPPLSSLTPSSTSTYHHPNLSPASTYHPPPTAVTSKHNHQVNQNCLPPQPITTYTCRYFTWYLHL